MTSKQTIKIQDKTLTDFRITTFQNAKRLLFESESLFNSELFPTSTFLSITSIEEMGKFYLGRVLANKNNQNKLSKKDLDMLMRHPPKQLNSFLPPFPFKKDRKISTNISKFWELVVDKKLMTIRNNCLYVGFNNNIADVISPIKITTRTESLYFLETAFEIMILQVDSLLNSLDCTYEFMFLQCESDILKNKLKLITQE